jgi:DNA-binding response OmpR family regulator
MNQPTPPNYGDSHVSHKRKRILYIDDDQDSVEMMPLILAPAGFEVTAVSSEQVSVEIATRGDFDLIVLENWLVKRPGIDLCKAIRACNTDLPIIFFSTPAYEKDIQNGLVAGANAYLIKPDGLSTIVKTVTHLIDNPAMP